MLPAATVSTPSSAGAFVTVGRVGCWGRHAIRPGEGGGPSTGHVQPPGRTAHARDNTSRRSQRDNIEASVLQPTVWSGRIQRSGSRYSRRTALPTLHCLAELAANLGSMKTLEVSTRTPSRTRTARGRPCTFSSLRTYAGRSGSHLALPAPRRRHVAPTTPRPRARTPARHAHRLPSVRPKCHLSRLRLPLGPAEVPPVAHAGGLPRT
jgi:hypothetical protein